jgi:hypothetical protein
MIRTPSSALFFGSGFSKWAAGLPVVNELFDFAIEPWGPRDVQKIEVVRSIKDIWDKQTLGGHAEQFIGYAMGLAKKERNAVTWYIARRLSEPFIWKEFRSRWRRHVLMIDENRRFGIEGVVKAQDFINRFLTVNLTGIITTNYDMLLEYALGTKHFNYGRPNQQLSGRGPYPVSTWRNPVRLTGPLPIAKIHGSISWDETDCYTDGRGAITGKALIVAPMHEKTPSTILQFEWDLATKILDESSSLST